MNPIRTLPEIAECLLKRNIAKRMVVAMADDPNTLGAVKRAYESGFIHPILIGDGHKIEQTFGESMRGSASIIHQTDAYKACELAVRLVKTGEADVLMKGQVNTDIFLKAVMQKDFGLLPKGNVLSYVCAIQVPAYPRLLFITDTAVIPFPDLMQKKAMLTYAVTMAHKFGIPIPKVALISAVEKVSPSIPSTLDYSLLCSMAQRGQLNACEIDGPVDVFLACDPAASALKGVTTKLNGEADVLLFPSLESCNAFYKGLMLFGGGELAGMLCGTEKPVVMMSRSESENSKFYCIALSCLMAD
jgi:phosphate butyryltransferase